MSSGYQMSMSPHPETPHQISAMSQSAPVHGAVTPGGGMMYPGGSQAYAQPSTGPYGYGGYGSPYGGVGPYSPAPVYHPSPRGYIPVEITHLRDQMSVSLFVFSVGLYKVYTPEAKE